MLQIDEVGDGDRYGRELVVREAEYAQTVALEEPLFFAPKEPKIEQK